MQQCPAGMWLALQGRETQEEAPYTFSLLCRPRGVRSPGRGNAAVCVVSLPGSLGGVVHLRLRAQGFYWGYSCGHPLPVKYQPQKEADACQKSHHLYKQSQPAHEQDLFTLREFQKLGSQGPVQGEPGG